MCRRKLDMMNFREVNEDDMLKKWICGLFPASYGMF